MKIRLTLRLFTILFAAATLSLSSDHVCFGQLAETEKEPKSLKDSDRSKTAEQLLKLMSDYLGSLDAFACEVHLTTHMKAEGLEQSQERMATLRLQRPNKFALIDKSEEAGLTFVSDGKEFTQSIAVLKRYVCEPAAPSIAELVIGNPMMAMALGGVVPIGGDKFYEQLMEGVTDSKWLKEEEIGDMSTVVIKCKRDKASWKAWLQKGEEPLLVKMEVDMSEQIAASPGVPKGATFVTTVEFKKWQVSPRFDETSFQFEPPEGSEKVESLFGGLGGSESEGPHELLGETAPAFTAKSLDGESIKLSDRLKEQKVVVLDFWATWCGPCVQALPKIIEVTNEYREKGVEFYAVNVGEDAKTIRDFLDDQELDTAVLLDEEGSLSEKYKADAIPQTVLIGKTGTIEVVHVGLSSDLREKLSDELDRLLNGEKLAELELAEHESESKEQQSKADLAHESFGTKSVWSVPGTWTGLEVDRKSKQVYVANGQGKLARFNAMGEPIDSGRSAKSGGTLRLAHLNADETPELLTFGPWGKTLQASRSNGMPLWDYPLGQGVDDVWAEDLTGDGIDEVVIGYNGGTGLHMLDAKGNFVWKYEGIGNVWHVTAGDFLDTDGIEVMTTSASGKVHVFDREGKKQKDLSVPLYGNMIRFVAAKNSDNTDQGSVESEGFSDTGDVVVCGSASGGEDMVMIDHGGDVIFTLTLPATETAHVDDCCIDHGHRWAAMAMRGGLVNVVNLNTGELIATVAGLATRPQVAWCPREGKTPLLIATATNQLRAFQVEE